MENLQLVFPEKPVKELKIIRRKFYRHMVDMFLEMIKSISISKVEMKKRFTFTNLPEIEEVMNTNKSILLACGHYASYEWMNALQLYGYDYKGFGIYKKIKNRFFDQLVKDIRGRYDAILIPTRETTSIIRDNQKEGIKGIYGMIADQSPRLDRAKLWMPFMGINVPVFAGIENLSRNFDMAVIYLHVEKVKRGYYEATFKVISSDPENEPEFYMTRRYLEELEAQIYRAPEYYLWTHKRWKHRAAPLRPDAVIISRD